MESGQSATPSAAPERSFILDQVRQIHGMDLLRSGFQAFRSVPGLASRYLLGVLLTLLLAGLFFWGQDRLVYEPFLRPAILTLGLKLNLWWSGFAYVTPPILWLLRLLCWLVMLIVAIKLASVCMGFWIDLLIERIIEHHRPGPDHPFSFRRLLINTLRSLYFTLRSLLISTLFFALGFVPLLGLPFSFIGVACSCGADILNPYLLVLAERDASVLRGRRLTLQGYFRLGWFHAALAMIPLLGWFAMPLLMLLQIVGFTQWVEMAWKKRCADASAS